MEILAPEDHSPAVEILKRGGVLIYPTETCYAIGCDATNAEAVQRLFGIKNRPQGKGLTVLLPAADPFGDAYVIWDKKLRGLAESHWPGPLNIVVKVPETSHIVKQCRTGSTVSVRRSSHPVAQALVDALGVPLVSTSANVSGEPEAYDVPSIVERYKERELQPDAAVDFGTLSRNKPSTLIALGEDGKITILRQGDLTLEPST